MTLTNKLMQTNLLSLLNRYHAASEEGTNTFQNSHELLLEDPGNFLTVSSKCVVFPAQSIASIF